MKLKKILISGIRNIEQCSIDCETGIHFFTGSNGQGKTTILESIHLLSHLKSFREKDLTALLRHGSQQSKVTGLFENDGLESELAVLLEQENRFSKKAYINKKFIRSSKQYFQDKIKNPSIRFHVISLNPSSTELIHGEPSLRRQYLNQCISFCDEAYYDHLARYQRVIDQKNALLKEDSFSDPLFQILQEEIANLGSKIRLARMAYLDKILKQFHFYLSTIAPDQSELNFYYEVRDIKGEKTIYPKEKEMLSSGLFSSISAEYLKAQIQKALAERSFEERARMQSLVGPHRDDWGFSLKDVQHHTSLSEFGSQGETRSALLALKLSECDDFNQTTGVRPVLLIDDFSSELDQNRRSFLLRYLEESKLQVFVTSTDNFTAKAKRYVVQQGKIFDHH